MNAKAEKHRLEYTRVSQQAKKMRSLQFNLQFLFQNACKPLFSNERAHFLRNPFAACSRIKPQVFRIIIEFIHYMSAIDFRKLDGMSSNGKIDLLKCFLLI